MDCLYQSLYQSQETGDVIRCINQQILCYITACDREQHMLNAAEDAITTYLIPKVEKMLVKDSMEGGEHSMSRRLHQGQQGLFTTEMPISLIISSPRALCAISTARQG